MIISKLTLKIDGFQFYYFFFQPIILIQLKHDYLIHEALKNTVVNQTCHSSL